MTNNINWKQKLSSRKLWAAVVGVVVGLAAAFGLSENDWAQVAGIVTSAVSVMAYIFGEASVDRGREENGGIEIEFGDDGEDEEDAEGE